MIKRKSGTFLFLFCLILLGFIGPAYIKNQYYVHILIVIAINILISVGLKVIMNTGLVSTCHAAFAAIGGYTSALAVTRLHLNSWVGLVFAILVGLIIAISFGYMLLRLKGVYFFIATTAFAEAILVIFTRFIEPFGGAAGIRSVPPPTSFGIPGLFMASFTTKLAMFYFAFILVLVLVLVVYRLEKGRLGDIWTGIQQAPLLAEASGINTMNYKIVAFALGSALAAAAGAFQCHYTNQVNPGAYGMYTIINYIVWTMVGGSNVFIGPIIGATCLTLLAEWLSFYESLIPYQPIIYSLTLILVILFLPDGLASLPVRVSAWYKQKKGQNI